MSDSKKATERLRELLDERGVEHYDGAERTLWGYEPTGEDTGIYRYAASEISGGFLQFDMFRVTPEQAIAATLGSGTCEMIEDPPEVSGDQHSELYPCDIVKCSACGAYLWDVNPMRYCPNCGAKVKVD